VLAVERELSRVQGEIESYQAQLNVLNSQIDYATITVHVSEPQPVVSYDWGIGSAFTEAVHAFVGMIAGLIVITGYLIPLAIYLALCIAILYLLVRGALWLYRRSKQRKETAAQKEEKPSEEKK
jgi:large-conductance mechanosensitive channel